MNVLFVSPEVGPLVRAGGLGDVVGALPLALRQLGVDVRVLCPLHRECKQLDSEILPTTITLKFGFKSYLFQFFETRLGDSDIPVYLLENKFLFDRPGIYADENGDYLDNPLRCFALSKAALSVEKVTGWRPDIFHAHDWMAAPLPAYLMLNHPPKENLDRFSPFIIWNIRVHFQKKLFHFQVFRAYLAELKVLIITIQ